MAKKKAKKKDEVIEEPKLEGFILSYAQKLKFDRSLQYMLLEFIQLALKVDRERAMEISGSLERP